MKKKTKYKQ